MPRSFQLLLAMATILLAMVLRPVAGGLLVAAVAAVVLWPVHRWLAQRTTPRVSALLLTLVVIAILLGPAATAVALIIRDGGQGVRFVGEAIDSPRFTQFIADLPPTLRGLATSALDRLPRDLDHAFRDTVPLGAAVSATGAFMFQTAMMLIALFFLLLRGDRLVQWLDDVSPLRHGQTRELLDMFKNVSYAVVVAEVITAAIQAVAALVGYYIAGVPSPIFFATVTFFIAFIPAVGAGAVVLVAALLMFVTGHPYMALFLVAWGLVVVGLIDNVTRPILVKRGMESSGATVFFALVGGLAAFGAIGLLIGPIALALFLTLVRIYRRDFAPAREPLVLPPSPEAR